MTTQTPGLPGGDVAGTTTAWSGVIVLTPPAYPGTSRPYRAGWRPTGPRALAYAGGGRRVQLAYAARQVWSARRLRAELRVPQRRGAAP
jgi:hypothetical protein